MDNEKKNCPLAYAIADPEKYKEPYLCEREKCMWWRGGTEGCAIVVIAEAQFRQVHG